MARNSKLRTQNSELPVYGGLVRWAFRRFYREFAWTYDVVAAMVSGGQWHRWVLAALPYLAGRVLELGCGTGTLQAALAQRGSVAVGLDLSSQMLALTRRKLARQGTEARLVHASAGAIPFPDSVFDTLVATFPSEYIIAPATLAEIRRVLRPDGTIVIVFAAQFQTNSAYRQLVNLLYRATLQHPVIAPPVLAAPQSLVGARLAQAGLRVAERWEMIGDTQVALHVITGTRDGTDSR